MAQERGLEDGGSDGPIVLPWGRIGILRWEGVGSGQGQGSC